MHSLTQILQAGTFLTKILNNKSDRRIFVFLLFFGVKSEFNLTNFKWTTFTSALSFGRLIRFHNVGMVKSRVIGYSQLQQEV